MTPPSTKRFAALLVAAPLLVGASPPATDSADELRRAASAGDVAAVERLLAAGAPVDAANAYGATALLMAADRGRLEVVRLLLARGADVDLKDSYYGGSPVAAAAQRGHLEVVKLLLEKGASDLDGALQTAIWSEQPEIVKLVLATGKVAPKSLTDALMFAEQSELTAVAELLRAAGAKPPPPANFAVPPELLARYVGAYTDAEGVERKVALDPANPTRLLWTTSQGEVFPLGGLDEKTFRPEGRYGLELVFDAAPGQPAATLTIRFPEGEPQVLRRTPEAKEPTP